MESNWKAKMIKLLLADAAIAAAVGWRIYPARLATVLEPKFPCINFEYEGGAFPYRGARFSTSSRRCWFYSEDSVDAATQLYELADKILRNSATMGSKVSMVLDPSSTPMEIYETGLFGVTVLYYGRAIHHN